MDLPNYLSLFLTHLLFVCWSFVTFFVYNSPAKSYVVRTCFSILFRMLVYGSAHFSCYQFIIRLACIYAQVWRGKNKYRSIIQRWRQWQAVLYLAKTMPHPRTPDVIVLDIPMQANCGAVSLRPRLHAYASFTLCSEHALLDLLHNRLRGNSLAVHRQWWMIHLVTSAARRLFDDVIDRAETPKIEPTHGLYRKESAVGRFFCVCCVFEVNYWCILIVSCLVSLFRMDVAVSSSKCF